jgi:predicted transcriptional regulator
VFAPAVSRKSTVGALVEDLIRRLGGTAEPLMAHLVESGQIGLKDLRDLEALLPKPKDPGRQ